MTSKERFLTVLAHKIPDRVPISDAPWPETVARWETEGLPKGVYPSIHFDMDIIYDLIFDNSYQFPLEVVEEIPQYNILQDNYGRLLKFSKDTTTPPQHIDQKVKTQEDWNTYKHRLTPDAKRIRPHLWGYYEAGGLIKHGESEEEAFKHYNQWKETTFVPLQFNGLFETPQSLIGFENLLMNLLDNPVWIEEIVATVCDMIIESVKLALKSGLRPDGAFIGEDMSYRNGPMFSPDLYKKLIFPYHKKLFSFLHENNLPIILHSDGDVRAFIPMLIEAGIDALQPLEVKAGLDVRELKKQYGDKLAFMGNIDTRELSKTKKEVESEIRSKVPIAMEGGGYIFFSDHSVPPTVSFENYTYCIELVRQIGKY